MIRRRWMQWGAVSAVAAVALTGCVGEDEPSRSPDNSPAPSMPDAELVEATSSIYQAFLDEETAMYEEFDYDFTRLTPYVTDEIATETVVDIEETHELGINFRGRLLVANAVVVDNDGAEAHVDVCIDGRASESYDIESGAIWEATASQINAWRLTASVSARSDVLVSAREPLEPESSTACSSVA